MVFLFRSAVLSPVGRNWELFPHGADVGVRGIAETKAATFERAALAMTAAIIDPNLVQPHIPVRVTCEAPDDELIPVGWLNALVYKMATRKMPLSCIAVRIEDDRLQGEVWDEQVDMIRHSRSRDRICRVRSMSLCPRQSTRAAAMRSRAAATMTMKRAPARRIMRLWYWADRRLSWSRRHGEAGP